MIDLVGFTASTLIIGSVMTRSIGRLRGLAIVGAVAYIAYGILLPAWPVVVPNAMTLTIHLIHLRILLVERDQVGADPSAFQDGRSRFGPADRGTLESDAALLTVVEVVSSERGRERAEG